MTNPNYHHIIRGQYLVLISYSTPVAAFDRKTNKLLVTSRKYSVTTTRHIGIFRKFCGFPKFETSVVNVEQAILNRIESGLAS